VPDACPNGRRRSNMRRRPGISTPRSRSGASAKIEASSAAAA